MGILGIIVGAVALKKNTRKINTRAIKKESKFWWEVLKDLYNLLFNILCFVVKTLGKIAKFIKVHVFHKEIIVATEKAKLPDNVIQFKNYQTKTETKKVNSK